MGPMTQRRSRLLGRVLMAAVGLEVAWFARSFGRLPLVMSVPLGLVALPLGALVAWTGYTLATMNWDDPADYPPPVDDTRRDDTGRDDPLA